MKLQWPFNGVGGIPSIVNIDIPAVTEGVDGFDLRLSTSILTNGGNPVAVTFTINLLPLRNLVPIQSL
jgi:hypothetical protein